MNGLALCAGIGGIEIGLRLALGRSHRTVCYVEREAFCAAVLVARMADEALDRAPIWDDLSTFEGRPWRPKVDLISAGFPCQPVSVAGKGLGERDPRWLWPHVHRIICEVEPGLVFLENVPGLINRGLPGILGEMAELGFDAEWGIYSAEESGAPHLRKRLFVLASHPERPVLRDEPRRGRRARGEGAAEPEDDREERNSWKNSEPPLRGVADGLPDRMDRLRALGNAVVPEVACRAFLDLFGRLTSSPAPD